MGEELLGRLYYKLEILRLLTEYESLQLEKLVTELGVSEDEVRELISDLSRNFLIKVEKGRLVWLAGDNPARIRPWGWNYVYKQLVGSTMLIAKKMEPWTAVVAEYQLRGYGRHGKKWISNLGGAWISLKMDLPDKTAQVLPVVLPVALCQLLREKWEVKAAIKWPNDIIVSGKKLAGMIVEGEAIEGKILAIVGVGMNVNNEPPLEEATSLKVLLGRLIPRNSIIAYLTGIAQKIESLAKNSKKYQALYLEMLDTLGRKVRALKADGTIVKGVASSVTETGDLIIETDAGSLKLSSNEVLKLGYEE